MIDRSIRSAALAATTLLAGFAGFAGLAGGASGQVATSASATTTADAAHPATVTLPLSFVANEGQWDDAARFVARGHGFVARFERAAIVLALAPDRADQAGRGVVARLAFEGAEAAATLAGVERQRGRHHFFVGSDAAAWRTDVPAFSQLLYHGLQRGIDVRVRDSERRLEYDVELAAGADLTAFVVRCEGVDDVIVAADGSLELATALGPIRSPAPTTWQVGDDGARTPVACRFRRLDATRFGFETPPLDPARPLVIDPALDWSTLLGGSIDDNLFAVAVDAAGLVAACGSTASPDFPTTPGVFATGRLGPTDAVVVRLDPTQSGAAQLLWSTYFGGNANEAARSIDVDANGIVTIAGETTSHNLPTTAGAFSRVLAGLSDVFVARFDPSRSGTAQLLWSTFFGGTGDDGARIGLHGVDAAGVVTLCGVTTSSDLPTTAGAFATTYGGGARDHFVARLDPSQSGTAQLLYATFLGGSGDEGVDAPSMEVDAAGGVTIGGTTASTDFPTTTGAFNTSANGGLDGYVARLTLASQGAADLVAATYFGGLRDDTINALCLDAGGAVLLTGSTVSRNFPTTAGSFAPSAGGPLGQVDAFVVRLDPALGASALLYGSYLGGALGTDVGTSIAISSTAAVFITGSTTSNDFPSTLGCFKAGLSGPSDAFVSKLRLLGGGKTDLAYSTYFGGSLDETPAGDRGVAIDAQDCPIFVGQTKSNDYPTTSGAFQTALGGLSDGYLSRLCLATWQTYGTGWAGTHGIPTLTTRDDPVLGATLTLDLVDSAGHMTNAIVLIGASDASTITSAGGTLLVTPTTIVPLRLSTKSTALVGTLPTNDSFCGTSLYLQALEIDTGASQGISFTAGLRLILGH